MERDELILSFQDIVTNLVKKYNNHQPDEDLQQVGMIGVIKSVDYCIDNNITDYEQIKSKTILSARNEILMEIYKEKFKIDDNVEIEDVGQEDMTELFIYLEQVLTPKEKKIYDLVMQGYKPKEIMEKMHIGNDNYYLHLRNIKNKIVKNYD